MKSFPANLMVALICATLNLSDGVSRADPAPTKAERLTKSREYEAQMKAQQEKADWLGVLQTVREWKKVRTAPFDDAPLFFEAEALYCLGDIDEAFSLLSLLAGLPPELRPANVEKPEDTADKLLTLRWVRQNFPALKLQPLQFVQSDASRESAEWFEKGAALLAAKKYDAIEATAAQLQKSNAATVKGSPHLQSFFAGLSTPGNDSFAVFQARIAAWRAARPQSTLAQLAATEMWTDAAGDARGSAVAFDTAPEKFARMEAALQRGAQSWSRLPKTAFDSPLAFEVALGRGLLTGAPRKFLDDIFRAGVAKFPDYMPLYTSRAYNVLPRWGGSPGEAEAMLTARADKIGGPEGDIFYGRVLWSLSSYIGGLSTDSKFDYARAQRGLKLLSERFPDSVSVSSARLGLAYLAEDAKTSQQLLIAPQGHLLDNSWWIWQTPENQKPYAYYRMWALSQPPK